jgi:hypothetical protein
MNSLKEVLFAELPIGASFYAHCQPYKKLSKRIATPLFQNTLGGVVKERFGGAFIVGRIKSVCVTSTDGKFILKY